MPRYKIREEMASIAEAPGKTWFWELEAAVIDADRCVQCGACVAACPSDSIGIGSDGLPELVRMCTGCSLCWDLCPRGGMRYEATWPARDQNGTAAHGGGSRALRNGSAAPSGGAARNGASGGVAVSDGALTNGEGNGSEPGGAASRPAGSRTAAPRAVPVKLSRSRPIDHEWRITGGDSAEGLGAVLERWSARVLHPTPGVQDGGLVSAVLVAGLEAGDIDGVLMARESPTEPWKGVAHLAMSPEEVLDGAGSFYNQTMALGHLDFGPKLPPDARVALVGTPCEVQGIKALQSRQWRWGKSRVSSITLTIALMCTKSFDYEGLMLREIRDRRGIALADVGKVDVIHGKLIVLDREGQVLVDEPVKDFHGAALKGCDECADFLGRGADLSVGSVGSPEGWSSVLVRTETGRRALAVAAGRLETAELERPEALDKLDALDKRIAHRTLQRPFDVDGPLFIDYEEHLRTYAGTDRAPVVRER